MAEHEHGSGMYCRKEEFGIAPGDAKHKEQQGVGGSEGNTQFKGIANQKGRAGGTIKRQKADINFPKASDGVYKTEL